jgi:flagellar protein FlaG
MSIGKVDSVDLAALRQAPTPAPVTPAQRATLDNPVFAAAPPVTQEAVVAAVQAANDYVQATSTSIQFSLDEDTGHTVVKMVDKETAEVLRQFPSEEMLAISRSIDRMQGLLINREA